MVRTSANAEPSLSAPQGNFADLHPPLTRDEAVTESSRCLYCFDAPCTRSCPTHIDIAGFIRQIMHHNPIGAARTILDANIFGGSCARVCPTEVLCEGACVDNTMLKAPVQIGRLQRFACDTAHEVSMDFYEPGEPTGKRVAVVGAGPAGLTCAHELRKRGHHVVVFEAREVAGGLNTLGIAAYKLTTGFALTEVDRIMRMGIDLRLNHPINGKQLAGLLTDYDAVFMAVGLGRTAPLKIDGEDLSGVWESLDFIFQTHTKPLDKCEVGRNVIVVGGGNTAMDAANAAAMLGAGTVTLAYRRDAESMPAFQHEYELANRHNVHMEWNAQPQCVLGENGRVTGVRFVRTQLEGKGRRAKLHLIEGSEFTIDADMVIKALGQEALVDFLKSVPQLELSSSGRVVVDPATRATSVPKLFAGGDCQVDAGEEVVNAVESGKTAAAEIHSLLSR